jgi:hypothetical protein
MRSARIPIAFSSCSTSSSLSIRRRSSTRYLGQTLNWSFVRNCAGGSARRRAVLVLGRHLDEAARRGVLIQPTRPFRGVPADAVPVQVPVALAIERHPRHHGQLLQVLHPGAAAELQPPDSLGHRRVDAQRQAPVAQQRPRLRSGDGHPAVRHVERVLRPQPLHRQLQHLAGVHHHRPQPAAPPEGVVRQLHHRVLASQHRRLRGPRLPGDPGRLGPAGAGVAPDNAVRPRPHPHLGPPLGGGAPPARAPHHPRPRRGPAGGADGELRGRAPEPGRRPRGDAVAAADLHAIESGEFFENKPSSPGDGGGAGGAGTLHLMGLVGPGGVHAVDSHLLALCELAAAAPAPARARARLPRRPRHAAALRPRLPHGAVRPRGNPRAAAASRR